MAGTVAEIYGGVHPLLIPHSNKSLYAPTYHPRVEGERPLCSRPMTEVPPTIKERRGTGSRTFLGSRWWRVQRLGSAHDL
jgi:hypothetical protein